MGTPHFYGRARIPAPRFETMSASTAREIGLDALFRFKSFEISADNYLAGICTPLLRLTDTGKYRIAPA